MKKISLRFQIVSLFVALFGFLFILLLTLLWNHVIVDLEDATDNDLQQLADSIHAFVTSASSHPDSLRSSLASASFFHASLHWIIIKKGDMTIHRTNGFFYDFPVSLQEVSLNIFTHVIDEQWFRVLQKRSDGFFIQVAEAITPLHHTLKESVIFIIISIPFVILISFVAGAYLVRRVLRPLNVIMDKAHKISSENLKERIPKLHTNDELDQLIVTLNGMIERLENSFSRMERFTSNASHELRTPLTILKGELDVALQKPRSASEYEEVITSNVQEVKKIIRIVDNLFMLTKIDSKTIPLQFDQVHLDVLLEEICSELEVLAKEKNVSIHLTDIQQITMKGDIVLLTQLFLNIVHNAIKYNKPHGQVFLSLKRRGLTVSVKIRDTGIGIPEVELENIFDRFYRVKNVGSRKVSGAGLGLSIAFWIATIHRGAIRASSVPDAGSTFEVTFPIA